VWVREEDVLLRGLRGPRAQGRVGSIGSLLVNSSFEMGAISPVDDQFNAPIQVPYHVLGAHPGLCSASMLTSSPFSILAGRLMEV